MVLWLASAWFPTWLPPARSVTRAQAHMAVPPPQKARWHAGRHGAPESRRPRWPVHPHRHGQGQTGVSSERAWDGGREETWAFSGAAVPIHPHPPLQLETKAPGHPPLPGPSQSPELWSPRLRHMSPASAWSRHLLPGQLQEGPPWTPSLPCWPPRGPGRQAQAAPPHLPGSSGIRPLRHGLP